MPRLSLNKKLCNDSKGVYSIIAAVFLVLIVLVLYGNVFVFMLNQNVFLHETVSEANQADIDRNNEIITISNVNYTVEGEEVHVEAIVTNDGPVSVQIITLWVFDATTRKYGYNDTLDINLKTGDTIAFTESNALIVTVKDSSPLHEFKSWFVSARGNLISTESAYTQVPESPPAVHAFGVFSLDWFYFAYTSITYPEPTSAGSVKKTDDYVAFYIRIINNYEENITLLSPSMIMLLVEWQEPHLNLVQDVSYPSKLWETDWDYTTDRKRTGSYSIHAGYADTTLTSDDLNTSDATSITVSFWYQDDDIDDDDVYLQFWDGSAYDNIFDLNAIPGEEDTWLYCTVTTSDTHYLMSDFHVRIDATGIDSGWGWSENLWIDDVLITKMIGEEEVTLLSDGFEYSSPVITPYDDDNPIVVGPQETRTLIFAAERAGTDEWAWEDEMPYRAQNPETEGAIVMTALVFTMETDPDQMCAQSLPFQALVLLRG